MLYILYTYSKEKNRCSFQVVTNLQKVFEYIYWKKICVFSGPTWFKPMFKDQLYIYRCSKEPIENNSSFGDKKCKMDGAYIFIDYIPYYPTECLSYVLFMWTSNSGIHFFIQMCSSRLLFTNFGGKIILLSASHALYSLNLEAPLHHWGVIL